MKCSRNLRSAVAPKQVLGEIDRTGAVLRDVLNKDFTGIVVDDEQAYAEVKDTLERTAPDRSRHREALQRQVGHLRQLRHQQADQAGLRAAGAAAQRRLPDRGEDRGHARHRREQRQPQRAAGATRSRMPWTINLEAAKEIARLLRLRDMGGIICVDFIDLYEAENRRTLHKALKDAMEDDKAKHNVLPPSKFGVIELTRQRVRPETEIDTGEACPTCGGTGEVSAPVLIVDEIENALNYLHGEKQLNGLTLSVHPFVAAYFTKGLPSIQWKWWWRWKKWVKVSAQGSNRYLEFHILDGEGKEVAV
jgi:ribonuclease G